MAIATHPKPPLLSILLLMFLLLPKSRSTKLVLISSSTPTSDTPSSEIVEIPQLHDHPFSCQLVFFNVHNNNFQVNITQVPNNVTHLVLEVLMRNERVFWGVGNVSENGVVFGLELEGQEDSYQVIMDFGVSYRMLEGDGVVEVDEQRKAYMLFCEKGETSYMVRLPNITIAITQAIGLAFILILPWNIQYRKFLPFTFNILTCLLYIVTLIIALYLQIIFPSESPTTSNIIYDFQRYFVGMMELVCMVMYSQDLLMLVCQKNRVAFGLGFLFSGAVMGLDFWEPRLRDAWFLNDIIAVMVAGAFIKFVIIRKIKTAVWALGLLWIFCVFREFAKQFGLQKFDQGLGIRIVPLFLQMPTFWQGDNSSIACSAFGSSKVPDILSYPQIIAFGVILNYCKRVDLYLSTQFYRILASIVAVLCIGAQLAFNLLFQDLPTIEMMSILLYYPLAVLLLLFFAKKRGEWAQIWHGGFYDMAVNRASIPRSISFEGLESEFGKDLMINSGESLEGQKEDHHEIISSGRK